MSFVGSARRRETFVTVDLLDEGKIGFEPDFSCVHLSDHAADMSSSSS